jgi:hypothetical protein
MQPHTCRGRGSHPRCRRASRPQACGNWGPRAGAAAHATCPAGSAPSRSFRPARGGAGAHRQRHSVWRAEAKKAAGVPRASKIVPNWAHRVAWPAANAAPGPVQTPRKLHARPSANSADPALSLCRVHARPGANSTQTPRPAQRQLRHPAQSPRKVLAWPCATFATGPAHTVCAHQGKKSDTAEALTAPAEHSASSTQPACTGAPPWRAPRSRTCCRTCGRPHALRHPSRGPRS